MADSVAHPACHNVDTLGSMNSPIPLTVRTPTDLLACVPLLLGFLPQESVVLISLPPGGGFHARVDLDEETDLDELARILLAPVLRHAVTRVALVAYGPLPRARLAAAGLQSAFDEAGIQVVATVAADGSHWVSLAPGPHATLPREYDALGHPFVAEAVVRGQVVLSSREAVRAQLDADPQLVREVDLLLGRAADRADVVQVAQRISPGWVVECLTGHVRGRTLPGTVEVARLLRATEESDGRDHSWAWAERDDARHHVEIWLRVLRGCAAEHRTVPAAVLAFHAWLAGDGALAWCAIEASQAGAGECSLTSLVEDLLEQAAPPHLWAPLMPSGALGSTHGRRSRSTGVLPG